MDDNHSWYNQDDFWRTFESFLFHEKRLADAPKEVENIITLLEISEGKKILDLCCGVGRHSLEFAKRGFQVTGVDRTALYLNQASIRSESEGLAIEFVNQDMRKFSRLDTYDIVVNLFTSFGYFESQEDDQKVVENAYRSLKPGGKLLIEMQGKELISRDFRERDWNEFGDYVILEERKLLNNWEKIQARWIILKEHERIEHTLTLRLYSAVEAVELLKQCGFSDIKIYGNLEGIEYDHKARKLVLVAQK